MRFHPGPREAIQAVFFLGAILAMGGCVQEPTDRTPAAAEALARVELVERAAFPLPAHLETTEIAAGRYTFDELFEAGHDLFHTAYNGLDGVGLKRLPNGEAVRRFDLQPTGFGPIGPASQSCGGCHNLPVPGAAGLSQTHILHDSDANGAAPYNQRSTTSVFGDGLLQLLAQEVTEELHAIRGAAGEEARSQPGTTVRKALEAKGISYGEIAATANGDEVTYDLSAIEGVDPDLVVRPIGWKGVVPSVRTLVSAAATFGMGMQTEDFVRMRQGDSPTGDLDGDGVERELSVGDVTAITVYSAALETPQELARLAERGWVAAPTAEETARIESGRQAFEEIGCSTCHMPALELDNTVFEEPTMRGNGAYLDPYLAANEPGYDPERPFRFDLLIDAQEPRVEAREGGGAVVRLYGDLKRHAMGRVLAEIGGPSASISPEIAPIPHDGGVILVAPDVFLTAELWGVGNTGPWLHDGRAGTLREAVVLHGEDEPVAVGAPGRSEAQESRDAFMGLSGKRQSDLIAFLLSLRTFSPDEAS